MEEGSQLTQLLLKQSWEQKKLSLTPSLRQVGHWRPPASFSQSTPRHFFFAGGSEVMVREGRCHCAAATSRRSVVSCEKC